MTKWERFAKEKGIHKAAGRNRLVYDDVATDWKLRYGGRSLRKEEEKRTIFIEHKKGADFMQDPFELRAQEKSLSKATQEMKVSRTFPVYATMYQNINLLIYGLHHVL